MDDTWPEMREEPMTPDKAQRLLTPAALSFGYIAAVFVTQPEILPVYLEWAKKETPTGEWDDVNIQTLPMKLQALINVLIDLAAEARA